MKYAVIITCFLSVPAFFACKRTSDNIAPNNPFTGLYSFDSIAVIRDTSLADVLVLMEMHGEGNAIRIRFTQDSVITYGKTDTSATAYSFHPVTGQLLFYGKSDVDSFAYTTSANGNVILRSARHRFFLKRL